MYQDNSNTTYQSPAYWSMSGLKTLAKQSLKENYWTLFLMGLLFTAICGNDSVSLRSSTSNGSVGSDSAGVLAQLPDGMLTVIFIVLAIIFVTAMAIGIAAAIFGSNIIRVGMCKSALTATCEKVSFGMLFSGFRSHYMNRVKIMMPFTLIGSAISLPLVLSTVPMLIMLVNIYRSAFADSFAYVFFNVYGFFELFVMIPATIAALVIFCYTFWAVPYLAAEHPELTWKEAFRLSKKMTDGDKGRIFGLEMSFVGWTLLAALATCGLGTVFISPYAQVTYAWLYRALETKCPELTTSAPEESAEPVIVID